MIRRTTIELDGDLIDEARRVLDQPTVRATVELALRRAVEGQRSGELRKRTAQIAALGSIGKLIDEDVLISEEAWR
jgi:Arc/MetJ family transcription regulator